MLTQVFAALAGKASREAAGAAYALVNATLDELARAGSIGTQWGWLWLAEMRPLRADPRFAALVSRLGLFEYWERYGPPDGYRLHEGRLTT